jgi:acyl carrier protein
MDACNRKRFEDLFKRVMKIDYFSENLTMQKLSQWDSLKHVELLTEIDEEFHVDIDPTRLWKMTSVGGIIEVLSEYVA